MLFALDAALLRGDLQGFGVSIARQSGIHIPHVFEGDGVVGACLDGRLQRDEGIGMAVFTRQQDGQVVVRLRQFGEGLRQGLQGVHGRLGLTLCVLDAAEQQTHLRVGGGGFQALVDLLLGFFQLPALNQAVHIAVNVGPSPGSEGHQGARQSERKEKAHAAISTRSGAGGGHVERPDGAILRAIVAEALFFRPRQRDLLSTCMTAAFVSDFLL